MTRTRCRGCPRKPHRQCAPTPVHADGDFTITVLHEPAEPLPKKEPEPPKKGRGYGTGRPAKQEPAPEPDSVEPKPRVWPDAFGVDRNRIRLKQGQTEKVRATPVQAPSAHFPTQRLTVSQQSVHPR